MKKIIYILFCVFSLGAPLTVKILKATWAKPMDIYDKEPRKLNKGEKIFIYSYAIIFGPAGLLIALMSQ